MTETNISYWEKVLKNPTPAYRELIERENAYLTERVTENSTVLDIGCGDGRNMQTALGKTRHVYGIDNDEISIRDAEIRFRNNPDAKLVKADATKLPFGDKTFDTVIMFDILQNLDHQKEETLIEVKRVLKDDGTILLCTYSEEAEQERERMYQIIGVPIVRKEGTKIYFDKGVGAYTSEQFSLEDLNNLAFKTAFKINDYIKVGKLAYLCTLVKSTP